jgi:hypothetical protein
VVNIKAGKLVRSLSLSAVTILAPFCYYFIIIAKLGISVNQKETRQFGGL